MIESSLKGGITREIEVTVFRVRVKMTYSYLFEAKHKNSNYIQRSHVYFNNVTILEKYPRPALLKRNLFICLLRAVHVGKFMSAGST